MTKTVYGRQKVRCTSTTPINDSARPSRINHKCNPMAIHSGGTMIGRVNKTEIRSLLLNSYNPRARPAGTPITTEIMAVTAATATLWNTA